MTEEEFHEMKVGDVFRVEFEKGYRHGNISAILEENGVRLGFTVKITDAEDKSAIGCYLPVRKDMIIDLPATRMT